MCLPSLEPSRLHGKWSVTYWLFLPAGGYCVKFVLDFLILLMTLEMTFREPYLPLAAFSTRPPSFRGANVWGALASEASAVHVGLLLQLIPGVHTTII